MSDTMQEIYRKIDKNFPSHEEKCKMICTLLGTSAALTEFVIQKHDPSTIPMALQYCILITGMNMIGMLSDSTAFEKVDMDDYEDFKLSEQTQETIYRKMKKAVELIVEQFKRDEEENVI